MSPELQTHIDEHVYTGEIRPDLCEHCSRSWHYLSPAARIVYTMRRLWFGRGIPDEG